MAPVRESGTAIAAAGGALWAAAVTCGPFPFPPAPPLPPGVEVAAELGGERLAALALGSERIPFGSADASAAAAGFGFESVAPLDLVPDEDEDGDEDIGA
jgi:hypothetical protein